MDFLELLDQYKANPRRESAALVLQDAALLRYCVCFRQVKVQRLQDWLEEEPSWEALWRCVHVDVDAIALLANDVPAEGRRQVERLKGLRLVYPDGSLQPMVEKIIAKRITDALS
jgi:hypothetical protein